ncbi:peptidylprolyl isomerase [Granulicella sibirica]|nr:peptidylprolyl isomerase [Granulicella sibirica]
MNRLLRAAMVGGAAMVVWAAPLSAQAPRYQSPIMAPAAPATPALPVPAAITPNGTVVEDVVVRVNDQIISQSDVLRSQEQLNQELKQANVGSEEAAERQKNMLRDMIDQQLLLSKGKELGINADAEVIRRLDEIRKQNHFDTMEDLEKAARSQNVSFEDFKANIRNGVITQQVVRDEVGRRLQMTQAQEQTYYEAHKKEFEQPEQIRLAEILIPTPADASADQVAQAQAKADDLVAKLKAGAKFSDLAKQYSGGATAAQGGELGLYKKGGLAKVLEDQTYPLAIGESTAPIRTRQGFVVLKVLEHPQAGVPPMKDVEQDIQQGIYQEQMQPALRAYLTKLREDAYVDIRPGYVDSGASPKQTKIINSAYAPPPVKKKKNQVKTRAGEFRRASVGPTRGDSADDTAAATPAPAAVAPATTAAASSAPADAGVEKAAVGGAAAVPAAGAAVGSSSSAAAVAPVNNTGRLSRASSVKKEKVKKVRREKIRFGQAPRNALPAGPEETAAVVSQPNNTPGMAVGQLPAPATAEGVNGEDPLAPVAAAQKKTRYSARAPQVKFRKKQAKDAKAKEKAVATPVPMSAEEKASVKTQSAPLGLNGDTTKKKKKRKKGDPKERLQTKPAAPKDDKFANPTGPGTTNDLRKTPVGGTTAPATTPANPTTLPPADAPAPGAPVPPTVPGSTTPAPGSTVPAGTPPSN